MAAPTPGGEINHHVLVAARLSGVDRIFRIGGAQAVAALAYGTTTVPRVDKITGPGNIDVATAKKLVFGQVGIDMIAGPSEILVINDGSGIPAHIAADLLSQAEHDELASSILITTVRSFGNRAAAEVERQLKELPRESIARKSWESYGAVIVAGSIEEAIAFSNRIAPEHLELAVNNPFDILPQIRNAGAIFLGDSHAGGSRGLPGRAEPHVTDRWHGPLLFAPLGGRLRQEVFNPALLGTGPESPRPRYRAVRGAGGTGGARKVRCHKASRERVTQKTAGLAATIIPGKCKVSI